ncbi:HAD family hydrolase [Antarcticibacterium arcticum]|uniref:HAD family hydrolase n=1 Tax=Antarcticibacterium arcticum TaxID=2585771 RepID=A0A5B8YIN5_9FLAO|nr:HAD family hydrolase [Antarcticibacterium arcticum]QED37644.1 HAD family hydrolase [Antarcticibacterium arcticum]
MEYKIVFSDIDGTLLNRDRALSPGTIDAIKKLKNRIPFILISARMPAAMRHLQAELEIEELPIISYNGGLVLVNNKVKSSTEIPLEIVEGLAKWNNSLNTHLSLYNNDEWYVPEMDYWAMREQNNTKVTPVIKPNVKVIEDWKTSEKGAHKIMAMGDISNIEKIISFLENNYPGELHLYRSKDTYLEIAPKSISKYTAVEFLLKEHFKLSPAQAIAFGDNYNDVDMLKKIGYGVAVGNAREEARNVANVVCEHSIEDGVAKILTKIFHE